MVTTQQANYSLNISLHVLILFSFLTIFFFAFISHLEQKTINDELTNAINGQVDSVLNNIDQYVPKGTKIDWNVLNNIALKLQKESTAESPDVKQNHRKLLIIGICVIVGLFAIFSSIYVYFGMYKGMNINWKRIVTENLIVFGFVGIIEYLFFTKIAMKYIPVTPDLLSKTILDRIKYHIYSYMDGV